MKSARTGFGCPLVVLAATALGCASAGAPKGRSDDGVVVDRIARPGAEPVTCYRMSGGERGLVLYLQGSGYESERHKTGNLQFFPALGFEAAVCEKAGISEEASDSSAAFAHATLTRRVEDVSAALAHYRRRLSPGMPLVIVGASEGGDIAARVARGGGATHVILLGTGSGMSQAEEFRTLLRKHGEYLGLGSEEELDAQLEEIRASSDDDRLWAGHPYRHWKSHLFEAPLPYLLELDAPMLLVQGTADRNVPIESARAARAGFEAAGKANLTLVEVEGADHSFMDARTGQPRIFELMAVMADWMAKEKLIAAGEGERVIAAFQEAMR